MLEIAIHLGVNIDHVASLRQARGTRYPDPVQAAFEAEQGGADSITIHLREDRRHIQNRDVALLKETLQTRMNLEMAVTDEMLSLAEKYKPEDCCLVPERREELTTEGGLDVLGQQERVNTAVARLTDAGIRVSLFIDADLKQIDAAISAKTPVIEIHTGHYAADEDSHSALKELERIKKAVLHAHQAGIKVHAGHGLHYHNVAVIAALPEILELNIGHAIIARAMFSGLRVAVADMKQLMLSARTV
ncbi:Pyridoxine 5'-phosphate synthase [hydrothermal vent metagenome]|uniref:Pyridoxine 5'-phosphate synthase n=1 Tax=hydrothermal vent metagenome TaxID=652676 RepID=A0A3B1A0B8_9ZZZZ